MQDLKEGKKQHEQLKSAQAGFEKAAGRSFLKIMIYALCAFFGMMIGLLGGYMAGQGLRTLAGGSIGLLIGLIIALFVSGDFGVFLDKGQAAVLDVASPLVPAFAQEKTFGHQPFSVLVTVHQVKSMGDDNLKMASFDAYVVVKCGSNPEKSTCVRHDSVFNETFKLKVKCTDHYINIFLRDQDILKDDTMGAVAVPVDDVINDGFPVMKAYSLTANNKKVGNLVLSFDWCEDFPQDRLQHLKDTKPIEFERRKKVRDQLMEQDKMRSQGPYGTFNARSGHGSAMFTKEKMTMDLEAQTPAAAG